MSWSPNDQLLPRSASATSTELETKAGGKDKRKTGNQNTEETMLSTDETENIMELNYLTVPFRGQSAQTSDEFAIDAGNTAGMRKSLSTPTSIAHVSYGSTYSLGQEAAGPVSAAASTANLLRIDLEKKIDRHTGEERESWDNRVQFILSLIGYAVGLGNVWRFPYLTQKNGGGAFLIPYAIMLAIEGIPLFYLELAIGQRLRKGAFGAWSQVSPYLGGLGIACAVVSFNVALYYNTIMAWCIMYFFRSFQSPLPWDQCVEETTANGSLIVDPECERSGSTTFYWYRDTLNIAPNIESESVVNWRLALSLIASWAIVYMCVVKGIKSSGKVVYFTATFPYLVLVIFFFRGVTLRGFDKGIKHLFVPDWGRLMDPEVWLDAATQIFYSFGLAFGCLIALSSYNPVRNNFLQETLIVTITDFLTAIFTAVVVFSVLGFKATLAYEDCLEKQQASNMTANHYAPKNISQICDFHKIIDESASGTGLAFIAFTEAIKQFPIAPLWSVLFFLMLFTLGLDSMFGTLEGALTSIYDMTLIRMRKELVCGIVCIGMCFLSLCFATSTGPYVFELFDDFSANIPLLIIAFTECIAVSYIYGLKQFSDDIEMMLGRRPSYFWLFCWRYLAPAAMILIFIASLIDMMQKGTSYSAWNAEKAVSEILPWPWWCKLVAALLILLSVLWIPGVALARYFKLVSWEDEPPAFFPAEELREEWAIKEHVPTAVEMYLFGFKK